MLLARVILRVRSPERLARFYVERLGMTLLSHDEDIVVGYGGGDAAIVLRSAETDGAYAHGRGDRYWKVGITLPNVDIAYAQLCDAGVPMKEPRQFGEIGYMCHLQDPEGFIIELLQHDFEGKRAAGAGDPAKPLGGGGRIGQITLRTNKPDAALAFYRDRLGMALLSVQPVRDFGFTLYFLAFTDERPPDDDLEAVGNREWLWKRPYTTLELQHVVSDGLADFSLPPAGAAGFAGIVVTGLGDSDGSLVDDGGGLVELQA
jgi:catechol 2,3-dioxygenase-like lactoylglutathione lyase family enzyme